MFWRGEMGERRIKVMIAYDGSSHADAAIDDLSRAGLPQDSEVLITTVVDLAASRPALSEFDLLSAASRRVDLVLSQARQHDAVALKDARAMVSNLASRLREQYPDWTIRFDVLRGAPAEELLQKAAQWKPDLIIGGSNGRSTIGRFFLGSVSKRVAEEARCSVRIVRSTIERPEAGKLELVIGAANPADARRVVESVANRDWPAGTRVRLLAVNDCPLTSNVLGVDGNDESIYEDTAEPLTTAGMDVSIQTRSGDPKSLWLEAVGAEHVDTIFVAGNSDDHSILDGPALGLITDARCTVEIVR